MAARKNLIAKKTTKQTAKRPVKKTVKKQASIIVSNVKSKQPLLNQNVQWL